MNHLVTISIPIFNCEAFIESCLESVRDQTYSQIEVTLINDQTKDQSVEIAERFIAKYKLKNWKILHLESNSGLSVVRNKGIETAKGKYIFFLDSDDQLFSDAIEKMVHFAAEKNVQMVVGNVKTVNLETGAVSNQFDVKTEEKVIRGNKNVFESFIKGKFPSSSWNKLIEVDFLKKNQLFFTPKLFAQDALQSFQTVLKLESVGFLHQKTYHYFLHKNSVIHNRGKIHFDNWLTIARKIDETLKSEPIEERKRLMRLHLLEFKNMTLQMNWRAKKDEFLWKESYSNYKALTKLTIGDYMNSRFSLKNKKADLFNRLPTELGFRFFKWRYER